MNAQTSTASKQSKEVLRRLGTLLQCLRVFQEINPSLPIQVASTFLLVAMDEGKSLREYMEMAGTAQSTMSRHLLDLADKSRTGGPGMGLIERRQDPNELRKNTYTLTAKGRSLVDDLMKHMSRLAHAT